MWKGNQIYKKPALLAKHWQVRQGRFFNQCWPLRDWNDCRFNYPIQRDCANYNQVNRHCGKSDCQQVQSIRLHNFQLRCCLLWSAISHNRWPAVHRSDTGVCIHLPSPTKCVASTQCGGMTVQFSSVSKVEMDDSNDSTVEKGRVPGLAFKPV